MKEFLEKLNAEYEGIFDFEFRQEDGIDYIIDYNEEFYYDCIIYDSVANKIEAKVREIYGKDAYIECDCPGRYIIAE